jgi:hypothetical protein
MNTMSFSKYLGYGVSIVTFLVGAIVISGAFLPSTVPIQFRLMCGIVLVLIGVYRFVVTRSKQDTDSQSEA